MKEHAGHLRWADILPGAFVLGVAEDHAEHTRRANAERNEYFFRFWGRVLVVTQRKLVYEGCWEWLDGIEECTDDDPVVSGGTFTVLRGGIEWVRVLQAGPAWTREA